jgi:hypothetical protein
MTLFLGTLLIVTLCCLLLGVGLLLRGQPLTGGCGTSLPGKDRCADCPHRNKTVSREDEP